MKSAKSDLRVDIRVRYLLQYRLEKSEIVLTEFFPEEIID
jgi:hypothetical protein